MARSQDRDGCLNRSFLVPSVLFKFDANCVNLREQSLKTCNQALETLDSADASNIIDKDKQENANSLSIVVSN